MYIGSRRMCFILKCALCVCVVVNIFFAILITLNSGFRENISSLHYKSKIKEEQEFFKSTVYPPTFENGKDINPEILEFFHLNGKDSRDELVNRHTYTYTLTSDLCDTGQLFVVVIVHSAPSYFDRRNVIRTTFGSVSEHRGKRFAVVFIIGAVENEAKKRKLTEESLKYGDIVQGNFKDTYSNLTKKHIMGMHWFLSNCNSPYVLKADDDTFINPYRFIDYLIDTKPTGKGLWCKIETGKYPIRRNTSKWYTSVHEYPFSSLPPFCLGFAYLATRETWNVLFETSSNVRLLRMDDLYVTGILAMIGNIRKYGFNDILIKCNRDGEMYVTELEKKAMILDGYNYCVKNHSEYWKRLYNNEK